MGRIKYGSILMIATLAGSSASASTLLLSKTRVNDGQGFNQQIWTGMTTRLNADVTSPITTVDDFSNLNQLLSFDGLWIDQREIDTGALTPIETSNLQTYIATGRRVVFIGGNSAFANWNNSILQVVGSSYSGQTYSGSSSVLSFVPLTTGLAAINSPNAGIVGTATNSLFQDRIATIWGPANNALVLLSEAIVDDDRIKFTTNSTFASNLANWVTGHLPNTNVRWQSATNGAWTDKSRWTSLAMPSNVDDAAFNTASSSVYTVNIPSSVTAGNVTIASDKVGLNFTGGSSLSIYNALIIDNDGATGSLTLTAATVSAHSLIGNGSLSLDSTSHLTIVAHNGSTSSACSIGSLAVTGLLDLTNNDLIIHNAAPNAVAAMLAGNHLYSSQATTLMTLGMLQNSKNNQPIYTSFDGVDTSASDTLIKFTYFGDADLNGKVDGTDYAQIDNGFASHNTLTGWINGDFNQDGKIDGSDYTLIDNAFNRQPTSTLSASATSEIAVPEPTLPTALMLISFGSMNRKRKNAGV